MEKGEGPAFCIWQIQLPVLPQLALWPQARSLS